MSISLGLGSCLNDALPADPAITVRNLNVRLRGHSDAVLGDNRNYRTTVLRLAHSRLD